MNLKTFTATSATALALCLGSAHATPVLDAGWLFDSVSATNTASSASPYIFTLTSSAWFRITDAFLAGDTFFVFNTGEFTPVLTTSLQGFASGFGDNSMADSGWTSASIESGEMLLSAGSYSFSITGNCGGGCPAGFYTRLDTADVSAVPLPASLPLLLGGIAAFGVLRRKKRQIAKG